MPEERTLPIPVEQREFTVKVDGEVVERIHQLLSVSIVKVADKISSAKLVYLDGSAAQSRFELSNSGLLTPGKEIEILAGAVNDPVSLFKGIVIQQSIKVRDNAAPQLVA